MTKPLFTVRRSMPAAAPAESDGPVRVAVAYPCLYVGGAERWLATLIRCLPPSVAHVERVWVPGPAAVDPVVGRTLGRPVTYDPDEAVRGCDVLLAWGLLPSHLPRRFRGPKIAVSHGDGAWCRSMLASLAPACTHYAAVSTTARDAYPARLRDRVAVIPPGVELDRIVPTLPREEARRRLGILDGVLAVGCVGRWSGEKDPLAACRAVGALPGSVAVYVGRPAPTGDDEFRAEAVRLSGGRVMFHPPADHMGDVYSALDCLVLTAPVEGWGLVIGEAWAARLPVIASRSGVILDTPEDVAVTMPTGADGPTLAEAVKLAVSPENRPRVERAAAIVASRYSAAAMGRAWGEFLGSVVCPAAEKCYSGTPSG